MARRPLDFLKSTGVRVVTLILLLQAIAYYAFSREEYVPTPAPLTAFPMALGSWGMTQDVGVEQDVREVLQADDLLNRNYARPGEIPVNLFVAAFKSQRNGKTPHSPKNCLPGAGWVQLVNDRIPIDMPGFGTQVVNHYVISHGDDRSVVLYWYQTHDRVVASEYRARFFVVVDAMRYNRSDTALVRIIAPVVDRDQDRSDKTVIEFAKAAAPALREALPK